MVNFTSWKSLNKFKDKHPEAVFFYVVMTSEASMTGNCVRKIAGTAGLLGEIAELLVPFSP
jgi:hypothetical protein